MGFALKARDRLRVTSNFLGQELEGDKAMQARIFSFIDDTHPAAAKLLDDAVVRDSSPDHRSRILRSHSRGSMEVQGQWYSMADAGELRCKDQRRPNDLRDQTRSA